MNKIMKICSYYIKEAQDFDTNGGIDGRCMNTQSRECHVNHKCKCEYKENEVLTLK